MSRINLEDSKAEGLKVTSRFKFQPQFLTLGATFTMNGNMNTMQVLDPGGAGRTVLLPAEAEGLVFIIVNAADAAEDLTVKEDSNTTTIVTVSQNEATILVCDGTVWRQLLSKGVT